MRVLSSEDGSYELQRIRSHLPIRLTVENGEGLNHALELTDIEIVCPDCAGASPPNILDPPDVAVDERFSP